MSYGEFKTLTGIDIEKEFETEDDYQSDYDPDPEEPLNFED